MKKYRVTYALHNRMLFAIVRSDTFLNACKLFIKEFIHNEILKIELTT